MNKRFLLKSIISLYQTYNLNLYNLNDTNSFYINTINSYTNDTNKIEDNKWFDMSYNNIYNLAILSNNVYYERDNKNWNDTCFNNTNDISKDNDTVRAYLFSSEDNKTHIISIKGTTTMFGKYAKIMNSVYNDKFNDNLFYSCCFYKQSNLFKKIDGLKDKKCFQDSDYECKKECFNVINEYKLNYINIARNIVENLKSNDKYGVDFDEILFTGHSLGGSLATVMAVLYNKIGISFQSPGIKNYILQSGILHNNNFDNIYNFGHNADIIFKGKCNGVLSLCYLGGYNIETKCHIGNICEYDAINKLNISESIFTHKLKYVIENIIPNWKDDFPECKKHECKDCEDWTYI